MRPRRLHSLLHAAALGGATGATVAVVLGGWIGEVLANLRLYLALGTALVAAAGLLLCLPWWRRLASFALGATLCTVHIVVLLPYVLQSPPPGLQAAGTGARLRLLNANLDSWAVDLPALERLLRQGQADIVLLTEITFAQQRVFQSVRDIYPRQFETPFGQDNTFIVRILARRPMEIAFIHPVARDYPVLHARFCSSDERCLTVLSAHAPRPGPDSRQTRNAVLAGIADQARAASARGERVIAAGDFNITAFSPDFSLFAAAGLADTALGRGYPATWPHALGGWGIGIDQVLVSPGMAVAARWLGPDIGSDHYPLFVELELTDRR